jgi:hypothetical protein
MNGRNAVKDICTQSDLERFNLDRSDNWKILAVIDPDFDVTTVAKTPCTFITSIGGQSASDVSDLYLWVLSSARCFGSDPNLTTN